MKNLQLWKYKISCVICCMGFCISCTSLKYAAPVVIKDGVSTGGETFELHKYFVLTKVAGFKVRRNSNGDINASFDSVENADSKAVDALADFAKAAMDKAIPKVP